MTIALEFDANLFDTATNNALFLYVMGLVSNLSNLPSAASNGAWFGKTTAGPNWVCVTHDGATSTIVDSTVAADTAWHRFRIVYSGATADDSGVGRVLFFIDGVLRANITTTLPTTAGYAAPYFATERSVLGASAVDPAARYIGAPINNANKTRLDESL